MFDVSHQRGAKDRGQPKGLQVPFTKFDGFLHKQSHRRRIRRVCCGEVQHEQGSSVAIQERIGSGAVTIQGEIVDFGGPDVST